MKPRGVAGLVSYPAGRRGTTIAIALCAMAIAAPANAQELAYTGAVHVTTGEYFFTERTTSVAFINGLSLTSGRLRLSASIPLYAQNSTALTYVNGVPVPTGGPDAGSVRQREPGRKVPMGPGRRGAGARTSFDVTQAVEPDTTGTVAEPGSYQTNLGDPLLQAGLDLIQSSGGLRAFAIYGLAKAPVADVESGVGTGEWDVGGGASLGLGGTATYLFADLSYWVNGDLPDLPLRNTLNYAVTIGRWLGSGRWSVSASVLGATEMIDGVDAPISVGAGLAYSTAGGRMLNAGIGTGLTESAADVSTYLGWRLPLGRSGL